MVAGERLIVVGTDGSPGGRGALAWALEYAGRTGARVQVVTAYGGGERDRADAEQLRDVAAVLKTIDAPPVAARQIVPGDPVVVLRAAAEHADMLVVGTRGRSRIRATRAGTAELGSVAAGCVRVGGCPVLVVPEPPAVPGVREAVARARRL